MLVTVLVTFWLIGNPSSFEFCRFLVIKTFELIYQHLPTMLWCLAIYKILTTREIILFKLVILQLRVLFCFVRFVNHFETHCLNEHSVQVGPLFSNFKVLIYICLMTIFFNTMCSLYCNENYRWGSDKNCVTIIWVLFYEQFCTNCKLRQAS